MRSRQSARPPVEVTEAWQMIGRHLGSIALYWLPASCARVPLVALEEIGEPFELRLVNKFVGDHQRPPYSAINPSGKVPALVCGDLVVTENPVIQRFLARMFPDARLLPQGSAGLEAQADSTLCWLSSGMHPAITRLRHPETVGTEPACFAAIRRAAAEELARGFDIVERRLGDDEWLFGDWSLADAYLQWIWFRAVLSGFDGRAHTLCDGHARRCEKRPSVARALACEEAAIYGLEADGVLPPGILLADRPTVPL